MTIIECLDEGWWAQLYCPGCVTWRRANVGPLIERGVHVLTWLAVTRRMACPTCTRKPGMVRLCYGDRHMITLKCW